MASESVTAALEVLDRATEGLKSLTEPTDTTGSTPLNMLDACVEAWKEVFRPQIAAKVGSAALKIFDEVDSPQPVRPLPYGSRVSSGAVTAMMATKRFNGYRNALTAIKASVERFGDEYLAAGGITPASSSNELHPRIWGPASALFQNRHYPQAVFDASKALVNLVKEKAGRKDLDGANLMRTVFSAKDPVLAFNELRDESEKDEQEGMMHLFEGAALAIRNPRAHTFLADSRDRALQYLRLLSLLATLLDETKKRK